MVNFLLAPIKTSSWVLIAVVGVFLIAILTAFIVYEVKKKKKDVMVKGGVRYTLSDKTEDKKGEINVSYAVKDKLLLLNREYNVSKIKGKMRIKPGVYTVLSADENTDSFNLRIDESIKSFDHSSRVVLAEGQKVSPTTINVILR
ncbi:MAG: hypothetical protein RR334_01300 [Clostridia bacterium]